MPNQERYLAREVRMQNFRWATPAGIFILGSIIVFFGWLGNDYLTQIRNSIADLRTEGNAHYDKLWEAIGSNKSRVDCLQNQLSKCCKDSIYCS
jgi:hypothetical protein